MRLVRHTARAAATGRVAGEACGGGDWPELWPLATRSWNGAWGEGREHGTPFDESELTL